SSALPSPPSFSEAQGYYGHLPSWPKLVARTETTPWVEPNWHNEVSGKRVLRVAGDHPLTKVWEDNLAFRIHALLDETKVQWTSTDVLRIGYTDYPLHPAPVVLWIGVMPSSLSGTHGVVVAHECSNLLEENGITDVDVEIRESIVSHSAGVGPALLNHSRLSDESMIKVQDRFTALLGVGICAQSTPWVQGTGGFFILEGTNTEKLLLVTARHVVFPPDRYKNELFTQKDSSQLRHNVMLLGDMAFNAYLGSIKSEIRHREYMVETYERHLKELAEKDAPKVKVDDTLSSLEHAKNVVKRLNIFHDDVQTNWATPESRILGHVILSPPISVGGSSGCPVEGYTEDWAVIEIDASKLKPRNFEGNTIDLCTRISPVDLIRMIDPNWSSGSLFYPLDGLLRLKGTISDAEMRKPPESDDYCLMVIKRGTATDLTVGRSNNICSYTRNYFDGEEVQTSKQWAILQHNQKTREAFSAKGDSGSAVVDKQGRIGGLLTSGARDPHSSDTDFDITYATPINFLLKRLKENRIFEPNLN
ncbi:hypothetical protein BDN70DRAFT_771829, partial [Pholiota conissans]